MKVRVVRNFIDKETMKLHKAGEHIEVSETRYNEITRAGNYVVPIEGTTKGRKAVVDESTRLVEVVETEPVYENMTVAELREYAEEHGVDLNGARRKDEIVETIRTATK